jgi:hypothetical protein
MSFSLSENSSRSCFSVKRCLKAIQPVSDRIEKDVLPVDVLVGAGLPDLDEGRGWGWRRSPHLREGRSRGLRGRSHLRMPANPTKATPGKQEVLYSSLDSLMRALIVGDDLQSLLHHGSGGFDVLLLGEARGRRGWTKRSGHRFRHRGLGLHIRGRRGLGWRRRGGILGGDANVDIGWGHLGLPAKVIAHDRAGASTHGRSPHPRGRARHAGGCSP